MGRVGENKYLGHVRARDDEHHADAAVEGTQQLLDAAAGRLGEPREDGGGGPRARVDAAADGGGEHARQVLRETA